MMGSTDARRAVALALALATMTFGLLGCDGGDDEGGTATAGASKGAGAEEISFKRALALEAEDDRLVDDPPGDKADIDEVLEDIQVSMAVGKGLGTCNELVTEAERAVAQSIGSANRRDCWTVVRTVAEKRRRLGQKSSLSKLLSVKVRADEATARVLYPDGEVRHLPFIKEDGLVWRAASLDLIDDAAVEPNPPGPGSDKSDPRGLGDRGQIAEVIYDLEGDFPLGKGSSVCFELTEGGQREIERSGIGSGDCAKRVETITRRALARGYQPRFSRIGQVTINGRRATAVVVTPRVGRQRLPFEKTADGWKARSLRQIGVDLDRLQ